MKTHNLVAGLSVLAGYYDKPDGYNTGAEHDVVYAYKTSRPLSREDVTKMLELGWIQEEVEGTGDDGALTVDDYNPDESWAAYV